eukprot:1522950-Amphidinium_carterae.1
MPQGLMTSSTSASGHVLETPLLDRQRVALAIEGMTCANCEETVKKALFGFQGVVAAVVHLDQGRAEVTYVAPTTPAALCNELTSIGFPASLAH